jgi:hypothetical protein
MAKKLLALFVLLLLASAPFSARAQESEPQAPDAPLAWTRVVKDGFWGSSNDTIWSLAEYKGQLYAGTRNPTLGAQVWRTFNGATWSQVQSGGMGDTHNTSIPSMKAFPDYLYLGTENQADGGEVWRTNGASWLQVNANGFGNPKNTTIWSMAGGYWGPPSFPLYLGTLNETYGANVYEYTTLWTPRNYTGLGDVNNTTITSMVYSDGTYVGTWNQSTGGQVWRYRPNPDTWTPLNTNGFGDPNNWSARSMAVFRNALFVGTFNAVDGAEVWSFDSGWIPLADHGFGDSHNVGISTLFGYGEYLYAGTENTSTGTEIWRTKDGLNWEQVNSDGFGTPNNGEAASMAGFGPYLFVGTRNFTTGGEVWRVNLLGTDQSFLISNLADGGYSVNAIYNSLNREYVTAWVNSKPGLYDDDLQAQRVSWEGRLVGLPFSIATGNSYERWCPAGAYDNAHNRYLYVWYSEYGGGSKVHARLFNANDGPLANEFEIPTNNHASGCPKVVYWPNANGYLVLYATYNSTLDQASVLVQLVTASGGLDGAAVPIRSNIAGYIHGIHLNYNATRGEVLLVWSQGSTSRLDIYGRVMVYTSSNLDQANSPDAPFLISSGAGDREDVNPDVASLNYPSGSGQYLVAWMHHNPVVDSVEIQTRRISGEGIPQGSPLRISNILANGYEEPKVIGLPLSQRFQVVWAQGSNQTYGRAIYRRQVDSAGNALGSPTYISGSNVYSISLSRGTGDTYLVAYGDIPMNSIYLHLHGRLVGVQRIYLPLIRR